LIGFPWVAADENDDERMNWPWGRARSRWGDPSITFKQVEPAAEPHRKEVKVELTRRTATMAVAGNMRVLMTNANSTEKERKNRIECLRS